MSAPTISGGEDGSQAFVVVSDEDYAEAIWLVERTQQLVDSAEASVVVAQGDVLVEVPGEDLTMWARGETEGMARLALYSVVYGVLRQRAIDTRSRRAPAPVWLRRDLLPLTVDRGRDHHPQEGAHS